MLAGKKDPTVELREGVKGEAKSSDLLPYWYSGIDLRRSFVKHPRWHVSDVYLSPILGAAFGELAPIQRLLSLDTILDGDSNDTI